VAVFVPALAEATTARRARIWANILGLNLCPIDQVDDERERVVQEATNVRTIPGNCGNRSTNQLGAHHVNFQQVKSRSNADHVAGQLMILGGLSSWVLETTTAPTYR
jgi:hypothetical protein